MSDPYIGEIRPFGFNFAPRNWAMCQGQLLSIAQNTALFSILGTTYGGNGTNNFGLPDLRGRVPMGMGAGPGLTQYVEGDQVGSNGVTLLSSQMPAHTHTLNAGILSTPNAAQNVATPSATAFFGLSGPNNTYSDTATPNTTLNSAALATVGGQAHENQQPYLALNFCICVAGVFPARN